MGLNMRQKEWTRLTFNTTGEDSKWLRGCYVGKTFNPEGVLSIQNKLRMEGIFSIKTIPMGGNFVLLRPMEDGAIESLLGDDSVGIANWFESLLPWR